MRHSTTSRSCLKEKPASRSSTRSSHSGCWSGDGGRAGVSANAAQNTRWADIHEGSQTVGRRQLRTHAMTSLWTGCTGVAGKPSRTQRGGSPPVGGARSLEGTSAFPSPPSSFRWIGSSRASVGIRGKSGVIARREPRASDERSISPPLELTATSTPTS